MSDDGGPAFPVQLGTQHDQYFSVPGMSLRDWFAGQALMGIMAFPGECKNPAEAAYRLADAMLAQRGKEIPKSSWPWD